MFVEDALQEQINSPPTNRRTRMPVRHRGDLRGFNHRILAQVYRGGSDREHRYLPMGRNEESAVNCVLDSGSSEFA